MKPCATCGAVHDPTKCKGHVVRVWDPVANKRVPCPARQCRVSPMHGQKVCSAHGGRSRQARAAGARRTAQQEARAELGRLGRFDPDERADLTTEFQRVLSEDRAEVAVYRCLVNELEQAYTAAQADTTGIAGPNHLGDGAPHVFVTQYERARERYARHLEMAHRAGIADAELELEQREADFLFDLISAALDKAGVRTPEVVRAVGQEIRLRLLQGGAA